MLERHGVRAILLASLIGLLAQYLFFRELPGINVLIFTVAFLAAALGLRGPGVPVRRTDLWMPAAALAFAAFCAIRADAPLHAFDTLAAIGLSTATVAALSGVAVGSLPAVAIAREAVSLVERAGIGAADALAVAWPRLRAVPRRRFAGAAGYLGGIGLAAPFVVIFALLFSSADAVFARSLERILDAKWIADVLREGPGRLFVAVAVAWAVSGAFTALWRTPRDFAADRPRSIFDAETATVALAIVDALFAAFVALQLTYLFGGRDTLEASGLTYASYARRGFFELIAAAAVVGALLFGLEILVRTRRAAYVIAALLLLALTAVVLFSAWYRLDLYQRAYGWSELRFYAIAATAFLGLVIAVFAWHVLRGRTAYVLQPLGSAAVAVALVVNALGPSAFVARANLDRVVDPSALPEDAQSALDARYLVSLGDGAVPIIVDALRVLPEPERAALAREMRSAYLCRDVDAAPSWQSWNIDRERARAAIATSRDGSGPRCGGR